MVGVGCDMSSLGQEITMNKDQAKGVADKAKGKVNEAVGQGHRQSRTRAEG
jgi:uncharacterized protein YjbJ (UPF0337 family)